jgi:hypothetical protein
MSNDSEPVNQTAKSTTSDQKVTPTSPTKKSSESDFLSEIIEIFKKVNWKLGLFIFVIGLVLIFNNIFVEKILSNFKGAVNGDSPTTKGTIIQMIFMSLMAIIVDLMIDYKLI